MHMYYFRHKKRNSFLKFDIFYDYTRQQTRICKPRSSLNLSVFILHFTIYVYLHDLLALNIYKGMIPTEKKCNPRIQEQCFIPIAFCLILTKCLSLLLAVVVTPMQHN